MNKYKVTRYYEEAQEIGTNHRMKWEVVSDKTISEWSQLNYDNALSKETLKFFRRVLDSKQVIKYKDDKTTILYSYAPNRTDYRYTTIIEEL